MGTLRLPAIQTPKGWGSRTICLSESEKATLILMENGLAIFDLDGTKFKTETVTVPAVQRTFRKHGLPVPSKNEICSFIGKPSSEFHKWLIEKILLENNTDIITSIDLLEIKLIQETGVLYPGIIDVLSSLKKNNIQMVICTNGKRIYVTQVCVHHKLDTFFDLIRFRVADEDIKIKMVENLCNIKVHLAVIIGDRYDDLNAAHINGIRAIAASYGYGPTLELQNAEYIAHKPKDLTRIINCVLKI